MSYEKIKQGILDCRSCPLWEFVTNKVPGRGDIPAEILIVGMNPGQVEDEQGQAFVGPSGRVLEACLEEIKKDPDYAKIPYFITNAVKCICWVDPVERKKIREPSSKEIKTCTSFLAMELNLIQPKLVVALGKVPLVAFGKNVAIGKARGKVITGRLADRVWPILVTWHPAYLIRSGHPERKKEFYYDLRYAFFLVHEYKYMKGGEK